MLKLEAVIVTVLATVLSTALLLAAVVSALTEIFLSVLAVVLAIVSALTVLLVAVLAVVVIVNLVHIDLLASALGNALSLLVLLRLELGQIHLADNLQAVGCLQACPLRQNLKPLSATCALLSAWPCPP